MKYGMLNRRGGPTKAQSLTAKRAEAKLRLDFVERSTAAKGGFAEWLKEVSPSWQWELPHLRYLRWFLDKVTRGELKKLMVFLPPRHGKPVSENSLILMSDGSRKRLGDVEVGDRLITARGRSRPVSAVHIQGNLPSLRITSESGRSTVAALSHPFLTTEGWKRADELVPGMVLANVPSPDCGGSDRPDEEFRLAGYFVGDGQTGLGKNGSTLAANVTCFDPIEAEDLFLCADRMGFTVTQPVDYPGRYAFKDGVREWLRGCGLAGKGSHQKRVPEWVFLGSSAQVGQFLGAYFSCDGSINSKGKSRPDACAEFYSVNRALLADVQHLLLRLGIQSRLRLKNGRYKGRPHVSWRLGITSQTDVARFVERVPMVSEKLRRLREWGVRPIRFQEPFMTDVVVSVDDAGSVPCRCLTVEEDHTFTSDDFVVHNTEQGSIRYPAYRLELDPSIRIGLVTHTQKFANRVSRNCRKIVESRIEMNPSKRAASEWETRAGGGMNAFGALGVGGGLGFNLLIIDDIIKGSKQAHSPTYRENLAESFHRDIKTRLEPNAAIVMTFTRWHKQDIGGMLLDSDEAKEWVVIKLPALGELDDPLGRLPGMALWPERWSAQYLRALQAADPWGFEALYQQNPRLRSGGMFLEEYFEDAYVDTVPADCRYVRYWDKAATEGGDGATTAGVLVALSPAGTAYIVDVVRGRWNSGTREDVIDRIAMIDGPMVEIIVEQEPGSGGKESAENTVNRLRAQGFNCSADRVTGDKTLRAWPIAAQCAIGRVKIVLDSPSRRWNADFVEEMVNFPQGALKDQVDAAAGAYNKLALVPIPGAVEVSGPRLGIEHNIERIFHLDNGIIHGADEPGTIWKPEYEREWSGF